MFNTEFVDVIYRHYIHAHYDTISHKNCNVIENRNIWLLFSAEGVPWGNKSSNKETYEDIIFNTKIAHLDLICGK